MTSHTRHRINGFLAAGLAVLIMAAPAAAQNGQTADTPQQLQTAAAPQTQSAPRVQTPPDADRPAYWTANAGVEADTHDTGYMFAGPAFVKPFSPNAAFVASFNVNYLYYEFPVGTTRTNIRSPGVNAMGGVRFGTRNYFQVLAGPGIKRRHFEVIDANGNTLRSGATTEVGLNLGADAYVNPTSRNNLSGMVRYGAEDSYIWSRVAFMQQVSNFDWSGRYAQHVGVEAVVQGNDDIRSWQVGPNYTITHVPSSIAISVRGGWKRSTYDVGPEKTGPWFAVGFWHRLR